MGDPGEIGAAARSEAVQPSLWERLIDDLPGLDEEASALRRTLSEDRGLEADRIASLVEGGARAVARDTDLPGELRRLALRLVEVEAQRARLREAGVVVTATVLREAVRRDIEMLFNVERLESGLLMTDREALRRETMEDMLADYPHVRRSVLNYGVPAFSGRAGSDFDKERLARELRELLAVYEPRLKRDTIRVRVEISPKTGMRIDIDGTLMLSPVPERLRLSTTIDLDSGAAFTALEQL